jgi:fucose permease
VSAVVRRHDRGGWPPVVLSYASFVLVGMGAGAGGVLLVAQMSDYGVDRATIGTTFFTLSAGYALAGLATGWLIQRFGIRMALTAGGGGYMLAGLYLASRPAFVAFVLVQLVTGFGAGVLESALNVYLAGSPGATTRLNRLHAFFGVGALIGLMVGFLAVFPVRLPSSPPKASDPAARGLVRAALREPGVLLCGAMLAVYVGLEMSMGSWGFGYLVQGRGLTASLAGYTVSGYWLGLTLGRFLISPWLVSPPPRRSPGCRRPWRSPSRRWYCSASSWGPVFPTTMAIVPQLTQPGLAPTAIGVINAASVVGDAALPWVAGAIAQSSGVWTLLPYMLTLAALQFAAWRPLARRISAPKPADPGLQTG